MKFWLDKILGNYFNFEILFETDFFYIYDHIRECRFKNGCDAIHVSQCLVNTYPWLAADDSNVENISLYTDVHITVS